MSLNGLDSQMVVDAHRAALAEPGGWFLLHYTSRDELGVRSQGSGGYSELCGVLVTIEEKSPLYGFFLYRRRKVLLKYVPEGTSRILQARVAVHFQAVIDHYPHDTAFIAASPEEINDTALSSKLSLHAEGPLASSANSLRQRNLSGISENSEPQSSNPEVESILRRLRANKLSQDRATLDSNDQNATPGTDKAEDPSASYEFLPTLDPSQAAYFMAQVSNASETPRVTPKPSANFNDAPPRTESPLPPLPGHGKLGDVRNVSQASNDRSSPAFDKETELTYHSTDPTSIDEHRPYTSDSKYSFAAWKPKMKLFPRPATNDSLKDPAKDNSARQKLPSSIRIALQRSQGGDKYAKSEKSTKSSKPKQPKKRSKDLEEFPRHGSPFSQHNGSLSKNDLPPPPKTAPASKPIPRKEVPRTQSPALASLSSDQVPVSPISDIHFLEARDAAGSPNSLAQKSSVSSLTKASMVAPEKARLMRALQQRNQQLMDKAVAAAATAEADRQLKASGINANNITTGVEVDPKRAADSGVVLEGTSGGRSTPISPLATNQVTKARDFGMTEKQDEHPTVTRTPNNGVKDKPQQVSSSGSGPTAHQIKAAKRRSRDPNRKRKTVINTNQASGAADDSDDGFASDDSFMEELQNAKLEEAQQVTIPHSPVSPVESNTLTKLHSSGERRPTITTVKSAVYQSTSPQSKSTSNQQRDQSPENSRSPPHAKKGSQDKPFASKRINASSGISRRIQTLAELSHRDSEGQPNYMQTTPLRPGLASIPSSGSAVRPSSSQTSPIIPTSQFSSTAHANKQPMSITARIVRPTTETEADDHGATRGIKSIDLQQSEVTVQHQHEGIEHVRSPSKVSFRRVDRPPSVSSRPESRGSVLSNGTKRSIDMGLNFIGLRNDQRSPSRAETTTSNKSLETVDELGDEKNKSKTSRLLRRMSGMANASSRKVAGAASAVMGGGGSDRGGRMRQGSLSGCIVGDLNVQFPDTLLWKRRWVEIDPSGFLVLSATTSQERQRSAPRRYHMTELKPPVIPSKDGQELPYSVLFDLVAGGTLQLACEDGIGQGQVLKRLADSHTAWIRNG